MSRVLLMILFSICLVIIIFAKVLDSPNLTSCIRMAFVFYMCIFLLHYFLVWFPKALRKSKSLHLALKIIFSSIDESVLDKNIKISLLNKANNALISLDKALANKVSELANCHHLGIRHTENAWKKLFLELFALIDKELKDETVRVWTFNKIINKLNTEQTPNYVKYTLKNFLKDSKYSYIAE